QPPAIDVHHARALEASVAFDHGNVRGPAEPAFDAVRGLRYNFVLARLHSWHVDPDSSIHDDAVHGRIARYPRCASARDQRLGRNAADVDAGAAEALALDDRGLAARSGQADGQCGPGLATADHDRVEVLGHRTSSAKSRRSLPSEPSRWT